MNIISMCYSKMFLFLLLIQVLFKLTESRLKISIVNNDPLRNEVSVYHPCYVNQYKLCIQTLLNDEESNVNFKTVCYPLSLSVHENGCITQIQLTFPQKYVCKANYWNLHLKTFRQFTLKVSLNKNSLSCRENDCYSKSIDRMHFSKRFPTPLDCIENLPLSSVSFQHLLMSWSWSDKKNVCPVINEIVTVLDFPISVPDHFGMMFKLSDPPKTMYDYKKFHRKNKQFFTLSLWFMLDEPCRRQFCVILQFVNDDDILANPLITLTNTGHLLIQGTGKNSQSFRGGQTKVKLDLNKWYRLVLHWRPESWLIWLYDGDVAMLSKVSFRNPETVAINVTRNFGYLGSSPAFNGITGYFGHVVWIHAKLLPIDKVLEIKPPDSMFALIKQIDRNNKTCSYTFNEINDYVRRINENIQERFDKRVCASWWKTLTKQIISENQGTASICPARIRRPKLMKYVSRLLRNQGQGQIILDEYQFENLAKYLYDTAIKSFHKHGIKDLRRESRYFKDSFCYGNVDAGYFLSTLHYYGVGNVSLDLWRAQYILMRNVLSSHRLSLIALGAQFRFGHGIAPTTYEPAFMYYKQAAKWTQNDLESHDVDDVILEPVRLTNEIQLNEQTDENGDLYHWIKHQAEQGIPWAKKQFGLMLYWGSQGVKRDLNKAYQMLKQAAESPENVENRFDIAMLMLKGRGADQNVTAAIEMLEKLAESNDHRAYNTLGWATEVHERNISKAIMYYEKAYKLGSTEAGYNLGIFHHTGRFKDIPKNKVRAFLLFQEAAAKSMIHAGIMYAEYLNRGIDNHLPRNIFTAVSWMQFTAEKNVKIGKLLRQGVKSYRSKNMLTSILYYLMAAYTGHETGAFNSALLCDENYDDMTSYIATECVYRHFNQSVQRELHQTDAYSLIKMGDYYWYGCTGSEREVQKSIDYYYMAAKKREPQGFFNLAYLMEQGENISDNALRSVGVKSNSNRYETIYKLYKRCETLSPSNSYLPCQLAAARIYVKNIISNHSDQIKIALCGAILLISFLAVITSRR